jgi:murein L,D-transpeptidase YcbB/YkuD
VPRRSDRALALVHRLSGGRAAAHQPAVPASRCWAPSTPPGYADGAPVDWLSTQLAAAQGMPAPSAPTRFDAALRSRLNAFQVAQGLKPDGLAGPLTLMQINRATGVDEPQLQDER